jgi:hypothetical protein
MIFPATLTNEHVAFYSTAATVIPVLSLGSILAVATFARSASRWLDRFAAAIIGQAREERADLLRGVRTKRLAKRILKPIFGVQEFFLRLGFAGLGRRFVAPLLLLGFLLPAAGEVAALSALASGRTGPGTNHAVWLGLGVSGVVALVPILEVVALLIAPVGALRRLLEVAGLRHDEPPTTDEEPSAGAVD